jgi:hypothetical protein
MDLDARRTWAHERRLWTVPDVPQVNDWVAYGPEGVEHRACRGGGGLGVDQRERPTGRNGSCSVLRVIDRVLDQLAIVLISQDARVVR